MDAVSPTPGLRPREDSIVLRGQKRYSAGSYLRERRGSDVSDASGVADVGIVSDGLRDDGSEWRNT